MRLIRSSIVGPVVMVSLIAACSSSTAPISCASSSAEALTTAPSFTGFVGRVVVDDGMSPEGPMSQLDVWVAIAPSTDPNQGIVVGATTRVFTRTASGSLVRANRCVIATGDLVEVWTGFQGPPQYSLGEPPPVYSAVQIAVHQ